MGITLCKKVDDFQILGKSRKLEILVSFYNLFKTIVMNYKRFFLTVLVTFIFVLLFEFLVHAVLFMDNYSEYTHLWRPEGEEKMVFMYLAQFFFSLFVVFLYTRNHEGKGPKEGLRFGLYLGLIMAAISLGSYAFMPISFSLTFLWMLSSLVECLGIGLIASVLYKN